MEVRMKKMDVYYSNIGDPAEFLKDYNIFLTCFEKSYFYRCQDIYM